MRVAEGAVGVQGQGAVAGDDRRGVDRQRVVAVDVGVAVQHAGKGGIQESAPVVSVPPSGTVKLSASATGVLSLTGVIVMVTMAVLVCPSLSVTS